MKILVVVPAFNEEQTIREVIRNIRSHLPGADILIVDDGSNDATGTIAREEKVLLLEHPYNMGIGATMQTGFHYAVQKGYDIAVQIDGDGQHNPASLSSIVQPILDGESNLVIGSRYLQRKGFQSTFLRKLGIRFFSLLIWVFIGRKVTDPTSGFRAMDRKVIELFSRDYPSDYPEVEALISAYKNGLVFEEIPTVMNHRQGGISSIGILSALYYMVKVTLSVSIGLLRRRT
jgi:glycosyltransferase involved in cell wall biosynthesis